MKLNSIFTKIIQEKLRTKPNKKYIQKLQRLADEKIKEKKEK